MGLLLDLVCKSHDCHVTYLRGYVVWGSTECPCSGLPDNVFPAHPKVSNLAMSVGIKENIVQLEISAIGRGRERKEKLKALCII